MPDAIEAIQNRRSMRKYAQRPVDDDVLKTLLTAAQMAPSSKNEQPWHITIVEDRSIADELNAGAHAHMKEIGSPLAEDFYIFFNAPCVLVISGVADNRWTEFDCGGLCATLGIAAEALGLGMCEIGYARRAFLTQEKREYYAARLQLPGGYLPVIGIALGYPDASPNPRPREYKVNRV